MPWKISRTFYDDDFPAASLNDKITIFEDRIIGWIIEVGQQVADKIPHSGFAVLLILASYFEMVAKFRDGYCSENKSKHYFKEGVRRVFPGSGFVDADLTLMYSELRSGLYHASITGPRVVLSRDFSPPISIADTSSGCIVQVNPHTLPGALQKDFTEYIRELRNPANSELRRTFEKRFDWQGSPFRKSSRFA